ncbi:4-hydroxy-tetrahydrodipicolinate synthase [bioreactor metagenome]|uniref:4-hydroxy-tetrahydrodipicolinate synthase n=1 Tax=bioreactor metagenome TaxID=1076179 RepID=A0A645DXN3_9ZZZZ
MGGKGVISVLSNVVPRKTAEICRRFFAGDFAGSRRLQYELLPLVGALFSEVNPIPVKAGMAKLGFCENYLRLPLVPMDEQKAEVLYDLMRKQGCFEGVQV